MSWGFFAIANHGERDGVEREAFDRQVTGAEPEVIERLLRNTSANCREDIQVVATLAKESGIKGFSWRTWRSSISPNFDAHGFVLGTGSLRPLGGLFSSRLRTKIQGKGIILRTDAVVRTEIKVVVSGIVYLEVVKGSESDISPSGDVLTL